MLAMREGTVGSVEVGRIFDTVLVAPAQMWFPSFDREAIRAHEHWLCPTHFNAETGMFTMPVQSFILKTDRYTILIDTCIGNHKPREGAGQMHMLNEPYLERLAAAGVKPEEVDYVMCTHLHVDHVGWNTRLIDGRWVPTFPNAKYVMAKAEYEATKAQAEAPGTMPLLRECYLDSIVPIVESGRHMLVDGLDELLGLVTLRPAPGHSPGNVQIELRSQGDCAIFAGDILHSPIQVPFWEWSTMVCDDQAQATVARKALLEQCVEEGALLVPGHFEAPHVGHIRDDHGRFAIDFGWQRPGGR